MTGSHTQKRINAISRNKAVVRPATGTPFFSFFNFSFSFYKGAGGALP